MHTSNNTKNLIVDTAIRLFKEKGYDNVSIKDICSQLSFGRSTFYYHFRTKEQIISEYFQATNAYNTENMSWILTAPNHYERAIRILLSYERHITSLGDEEGLRQFIISEISNGKRNKEDSFVQVRNLLTPVLKQCQESGEIANLTEASQLCELTLQIQAGISLHSFMFIDDIPREEKLRKSLKLLLQPTDQ